MRKGRELAGTLVLLLFLSRPAAAADLFTCHTFGGFNSCAGATFWLEENPELGPLLNVSLTHWSTDLPVRLTAIGFYAKAVPKRMGELQISPSFWSAPVPATWVKPKNRHVNEPRLGGYTLFAGAGVPVPEGYEFAVGGPLFSGDVFQFALNGSLPAEIRWVWRAQSNDGSLAMDCFQGPSGRTQCLSSGSGPPVVMAAIETRSVGAFGPALRVMQQCESGECLSTVPEPSTLIMLMTGLAGLGAVILSRRRARGRRSRP
jgi:hypothetical protein